MTDFSTLLGEVDISALLAERRVEARYHCHLRSLCRPHMAADAAHAGETWEVAQVLDISLRGVGLSVPFRVAPGTLIVLVPLIGSWKPEWALTARVVSARSDANHGWWAGCEFIDPLSQGQFNILLRNSA
jgi:hypothetical protein